MKTLVDALQWRYAVKKFTDETISDEELRRLLEAARLAPTSFGLQPFEILVIQDPVQREKLASVSMGQRKVVDSSHLLVFASYNKFDQQHVQNYVALAESTRGKDHSSLAGLEKTLTSFIQTQDEDWLKEWAKRQTYIALGTLLCACALAEVDACPMEGFKPTEYEKILGLSQKHLSPCVIVTLGRRHPEDALANAAKVRKPYSQLIRNI